MMCKDCPFGVQNEYGFWDCINEEDRCVEDNLPNGFDDPNYEVNEDEEYDVRREDWD